VFTWVVPNVPRPARLSYLCRFHVAMGMRGAIDLVP
jgi:plastocyanin